MILGLAVATATVAEGSESPDETIRRCLELIRLGETAAARACFAPDALPADAEEILGQAHEALQVGDAPELQVVNRAFAYTTESGRTDTLVYHVRGHAEALLVVAQTRETNGVPALVGLRWESAPLDLSERYPFMIAGVPPLYYGVLGLAVAMPLFILYSAIVCFRRKPHRRWLWLLFILLGIGKLSVVWVPGPLNLDYVRISPLSVQLLGAGIKKMPIYDPWVLSVSFPLGAAVFLWRQRARRGEAEGALAAQQGAAADEPQRAPIDP
jgi:hypothetical protein